eukprot:NODE_1249_length_1409_cov_73.826053_g1238_i0.p1 GENE.NODE_1249_length_1409_cov_73.826053_g1238_i0~~NODE_1249_length_1409_cov_73.826053_g1238_i0.p1  ORF type:complete len:436 (+),score=56.87 NODE_1249_length_1409_cov_73.826053_g1238_i0:81-1388(+)
MGSGLSTDLGDRSLHDETYHSLQEYGRRLRAQDKSLTEMDLANSFLGCDGAKIALEPLSKNRTLQSLDLGYNNLGGSGRKGRLRSDEKEIGMQYIAEAMSKNTSITSLNLAGNKLGEPGTKHVAQMLTENGTLRTLSLFNNYIDDSCLHPLCDALGQNNSLTALNLNYNDITDNGARQLALVFKTNTTLTKLSLVDNDGVSDSWVKEIGKYLAVNSDLQAEVEAQRREKEQREKERLEQEEATRAKREADLRAQREKIEEEFRVLEAQRQVEVEARAQTAEREERRRLQKQAIREAREREKEEHTENLVNLAYAWRQTLRGGERRGREWRSGFTTVSDSSYGIRDTFSAPSGMDGAVPNRRLVACWCEPTEQTAVFAGQLHYHCVLEPATNDAVGPDGKPRKYCGCNSTAHRCRSAPLAQQNKDRRTNAGLFDAA